MKFFRKTRFSANPKQILLRAQARKTIKGAIHVADLDSVPSAVETPQQALANLAAIPEFKKQMASLNGKKSEDEEEVLKIFE